MDYGENEVQEYDFYYMLHRREDSREAWRILPVSSDAIYAMRIYSGYDWNKNWFGFSFPHAPIEEDVYGLKGLRGCYIDHYNIVPRP